MDAKVIAIGGSIVAVVVLIVLWQARKDAMAIGGAVVDAVNPLNPQNVFASAVNSTGAALTGESSFRLGFWIHDVINPAPLSATP